MVAASLMAALRDTSGETPARIAGRVLNAEIEPAPNPEDSDHVWLHMALGDGLRFVVTLNTLSKRNRDAGYDPRVRIARVRQSRGQEPESGIFPGPLLDYRQVEAGNNVFYETPAHDALRETLVQAAERCSSVEAWGFLFGKGPRRGLHQVHCRHASCAVAEHLEGCDGAVRFHFPGEHPVLCLFKFCGQ